MTKKIAIGMGVLVMVAVTAGLVLLFTSLDYIVKSAMEKFGPRFTQTSVRVGGVKISLSDGECKIKRFRLGNPRGFKSDYAFKVDVVDVAVEPASITKKVLHIRKIAVLSPSINYESLASGNNLETIQRNIEKSLGSEKKTDKKGRLEKSPEKKMIVDVLTLRDVKVDYSSPLVKADLTLSSIEMYNIGKDKGGVTGGELAMLITETLALRIAKASTGSLGSTGGKAIEGANDLLKGVFKQ